MGMRVCGDLSIASLLFADDMVLLASSDHDLQHPVGGFAAECEMVGMRVNTSKSKATVLCWKTKLVSPVGLLGSASEIGHGAQIS